MAEEFKAITTQEEFDAAIKDRIARERAKFADYEDLKNQIKTLTDEKSNLEKASKDNETKYAGLQNQLDEANKKAKSFELDSLKTNAAIENKLPLELRSRLTGETKEEIDADAKKLSEIFGKQSRTNLPGFEVHEHGGEEKNESREAIKGVLKELKGEK